MTFLPVTTDEDHWSNLRGELVPFIGERAASLFGYAVCDATGCLVWSVFFRRDLVDDGEDADSPQVTEAEQLLIDWARLIATEPTGIPGEFAARVEQTFAPPLRALLIAFAAHLIANCVVAIVGRSPLDESLYDYRKPGDERTSG